MRYGHDDLGVQKLVADILCEIWSIYCPSSLATLQISAEQMTINDFEYI